MIETLWLVMQDAFWSAIAAVGFSVLFNVPRRALWGCALAGAIGHALRTLLMQELGTPIEVATFVGATTVGFIGVALARRLRAPSLIFSVSGSIPMVPGLFAYRAMLALLRLTTDRSLIENPTLQTETLQAAAVDGIRVGLILGAIALGIIMPKLLFRREKPVV
ncbi:MAG: threonine/serine exporter family protein [Anaerolineae bacterium]